MGEMAELYLSSQDDIDFYEEAAMNGYGYPSRIYGLIGGNSSCASSSHGSGREEGRTTKKTGRCMPAGCWVDKNGEVQKIIEMSDQYLGNLIRFLEKNPLLIKQNCEAFEQMIIERHRRVNHPSVK